MYSLHSQYIEENRYCFNNIGRVRVPLHNKYVGQRIITHVYIHSDFRYEPELDFTNTSKWEMRWVASLSYSL